MLSVRGISYIVSGTAEAEVPRDIRMIGTDLHCSTVMLIGDDCARLIGAARIALESGLDIYLRPDATDLAQPVLLSRLATVSRAAEDLRREYPGRVTLLVGSEFTHSAPGIVPGPKSFLRLKLVLRWHRLLRRRLDRRLHTLLGAAAATARRHFHGPLTYAAAGWEHVDWSLFDLVGVSLYRGARNHADYTDLLRSLVRTHEKPVVITEFGCGAFSGADRRGAGSFQIVNWFADPPYIRGSHPRDESVQARYLSELTDLYDAEGVHGCFVFTFVMPDFPHREDPRLDLDRAGFGLVAVGETDSRRPKAAFHEVARRYREKGARTQEER